MSVERSPSKPWDLELEMDMLAAFESFLSQRDSPKVLLRPLLFSKMSEEEVATLLELFNCGSSTDLLQCFVFLVCIWV